MMGQILLKMPFKFNNTTLTVVKFNGTTLTEVKFNNVVVFSTGSAATNWAWQSTVSSDPGGTYDVDMIGTAQGVQDCDTDLTNNYPPANYNVGDTALYEEQGQSIWHLFEAE